MVNIKKIINKFKVKKLTPKSIVRLSGVGNQQYTGRPRNSEKKFESILKK